MNNPFTNMPWSQISKWKLFLIALLGLFAVAVVLSVVQSLFSRSYSTGSMIQGGVYDMSVGGIAYEEASYAPSAPMLNSVSRSNTMMESDSVAVGDDAEDYEALSYRVTYKGKDIENTCDSIESWKPLAYVVFEYTNRGDTACTYRFKVERSYVDGVLAAVKELNPTDFTANTATMKKQVVEFEGQLAILLRKQEILEETLQYAQNSYDEIARFAREQGDSESFTKIINSKLATVERLTNERENLANRIETLARRSAEVQDQIEYVSFSVNVYKYRMFDLDTLKDSWVRKVSDFVSTINLTLQELTIGVLSRLLGLLVVMVYGGIFLFVLFVAAKFGWQFTKDFWKI